MTDDDLVAEWTHLASEQSSGDVRRNTPDVANFLAFTLRHFDRLHTLASGKPTGPPNYNPKTLAARWQCSDSTVRAVIKSGKLNAFTIGGLLRISAAEVERYERES